MIKKEEAKMLLYKFLREHGLATRYYYNCIHHNYYHTDERVKMCKLLSGKDRLKKIIDMHINDYLEDHRCFSGFFNYSDHSFEWVKTEEGFEFWEKWCSIFNKKYIRISKEFIEE